MYSIVDDIEAYPAFLPWCRAAREHTRNHTSVEASLELRRGGISQSFKTRNVLRANEAIEMFLLDGPFKHLAGAWKFQDLGEQGCKVSLDLEFEFKRKTTDLLFGPFFEDTCNSMIDAFTQRAAAVYNESSDAQIDNG